MKKNSSKDSKHVAIQWGLLRQCGGTVACKSE